MIFVSLSVQMTAIKENECKVSGCSVVQRLACLPLTSEVPGSNLGQGASGWNVGSYLPMPGGLQCRILTN